VPRRVVIGISPPMPTEDCRCQSVRMGQDRVRTVWSACHRGRFHGGDLSSDGGVLLLQAGRCASGPEPRGGRGDWVIRAQRQRPAQLRSLLAQRMYGLCWAGSDVCDHNVLRNDLVMQTAVGAPRRWPARPRSAAWRPRHARMQAWALHEVLMQQFIASHAKPPARNWCSTSMPRTCRCTASRSAATSTPTTTTTATCRCTSSAARTMLACVLRPSDRRDPASVVSALIKRLLTPAAPGLAEDQDHRAGRLGLLPPSRAAAPGALGA
jgi:hypothetical protein